MKRYQSMFAAAAGLFLTLVGCKDDFAELNQAKDSITSAEPTYLFAQAVLEFEPSPYMMWFANASGFYYATQMAVPSGSVTDAVIEGSERQGIQAISVLSYVNALKYERSLMTEEESAQYEGVAAALDVLAVYLGIYDTDICGDIPFTEAANARYGGTLTPKYDRVEDLYDLWLATLDNAVEVFSTASSTGQIEMSTQDVIYNGDWDKWAKLANSMKLKIAARLIFQDYDRAQSVVTEVVNAACGVMDGEDDDFLFHKADENTSSNDYVYHWNNSTLWYAGVCASQPVVDFLLANEDPRVRFFYEKNDWNSEVVDYFLAQGRKDDIPSFILDNVETEMVNGVETFKAWTGQGEPWVRYYGLPVAYNAASSNSLYGDWFNYDINTLAGSKTYRPYSRFQEELIRGRIDFTLPTVPNGAVIEDTDDNPWYGMYMTTAEVNLYLAEFAAYGVSGLQSASYYFDKAVRASVEEYDRLASLNKIPYYGKTYNYDSHEEVIDLQDGEVDALMQHDAYQLTGDRMGDLEKIFIQQLLHFTYQPVDQFATGRRSGVPMFGSSLLPREDYTANSMSADRYPRRTSVSDPSPTDLMYDNILESYTNQGFSTTLATGILNSERLWQDKGAPQWGDGPSLP
ncbi:MAG: SusD/RagB family nutrient-binding outer membrane lipoprotein [Bacteroidales bacterium]|nr:SusD/RagB family nutrient-binding outer membrane lipoprotein [Bacteroidales bacterium]